MFACPFSQDPGKRIKIVGLFYLAGVMISEYKTNDKFPSAFLFVSWFLNGHPVSSSLGPPFLVQLKSVAPSPGRRNLSKRYKCLLFFFFFQTPLCSSLHRNLLHCKWQPSNHHLEVRGELPIDVCPSAAAVFGYRSSW